MNRFDDVVVHDYRYDEGLRNRKENISPTLTTKYGWGGLSGSPMIEVVRIRKLTPREYWRLMGFSDEDFDKAHEVNSNSQLYKQAGNSIVVNVLMAIFGEML
jgi:DNA (cytosine-5)-methyltransferase 1